ncbi:MAG: single-stranded DNA-binding protein [Catonella sp.]|uniref:single-stranded DNA-binding protein n=1 Tax=Catonella sp. TaxID=2382125 RepID=UPI003F9FC74B
MEYRKNIRATDSEMEKLFDNEEYNYSVRYYEKIGNDLFKTTIRVPETIKFPKSDTVSISTIRKILETKENLNSMYIEDEFEKIKNKINGFNLKKYPNYEDMDIKLILSQIKGIDDFKSLSTIYDGLKESGKIEELKKNIGIVIDDLIHTDEKVRLQEETKMKLEKGNIIKTDLSDNTIVLDMDNKQKQAVLFSGNQFVIASGIKENKEKGKFEWDNGRYANDIKTISDMKNNSFEAMKDTISFLAEYNHKDFIKAVISIETGVENEDILDNAYDNYMNDSVMGLVAEKFYEYVEDENLEKGIGEKNIDDVKKEENTEEKENERDKKAKKETEQKTENLEMIEITGNIVKDIEVKELISKDGKPFKAANFSVAENNDGEVKYTNCLAYNDRAEDMKDLKKGDFVKVSGQEKKTTGKDGREYTNLKVSSIKLLKAKEQIKEQTKEEVKEKSSAIGKLKGYKEKVKEQSKEDVKKSKNVER